MTAEPNSSPVARIAAALSRNGRLPRRSGDGFKAHCPVPGHGKGRGDRDLSLKVSEGRDGRALVHCHAGCDVEDVVAALGLQMSDLYPGSSTPSVASSTPSVPPPAACEDAGTPNREPRQPAGPVQQSPDEGRGDVSEPCDLPACARAREREGSGISCIRRFLYVDADGVLVGQVHRWEPKSFRPFTLADDGAWRLGGSIPPVPYQLPHVRNYLGAGGTVLIVEGEKDADTINHLGRDDLAATTNAGGAGKWTPGHTQHLAPTLSKGAGQVIVVGDDDDPGRKHAEKVADTFIDAGLPRPRVVFPSRGKDVSDHLDAGGTIDELLDSVTAAGSWKPVSLGPFLDGTVQAPEATLLPRSDGIHLLYPGKVHSLHGEPESAKSLIAQNEVTRLINSGQDAAIIDYESDAASTIDRLRHLGAHDDAIQAHLTYLRPDSAPTTPNSARDYKEFLNGRYALVVVDGVTEAFSIATGASSSDNDALSGFLRDFPARIARHTGAAVLLLDHVAKNSDSRGRYAIGGQHKLASIDGAAYLLDVKSPLGLGIAGEVSIRVAKDRPGTVRAHAGEWRKSDRTQEIARVSIDATTPGHTRITVHPPTGKNETSFRPTRIMEDISRHLEDVGQPRSENAIRSTVSGKTDTKRDALNILVREGYVARESGSRNSMQHRSVKPYRASDDPHTAENHDAA